MRRITEYGPALIVLATVGLVLLLGPRLVRELAHARTQAQIHQAKVSLSQNPILDAINQAHRDIATIVEPSVVYISTQKSGFFDRSGARVLSSGSGWVYDELGHIVTNDHVIRDAERIEVQLYNGQLLDAEFVGSDPETDIAVIRVPPRNLIPARRGAARDVKQGDTVFAFGSPFDFRFSMSEGIISGLGRTADIAMNENYIQTDAAINPGNSGGPLTNVQGEVIGMNTAIATAPRGNAASESVFSGIGLAIPIDMIDSIVRQIISNQQVVKSVIGIYLPESDEQNSTLLQYLGYIGRGVVIRSIYADSPAQDAGLEGGDVITAVDDQPVEGLSQLRATISSKEPGDTVRVTVWRAGENGGHSLSVAIYLARRDSLSTAQHNLELQLDRLYGFQQIATATTERTTQLGIEFRQGVLIWRVRRNSKIDGSLPIGTIITAVNGTPIIDVRTFLLVLQETPASQFVLDVVLPDGREERVRLDR